MALKTSSGAVIRTSRGAVVNPTFLPVTIVILLPEPNPIVQLSKPRALKTNRGALIFDRSGRLVELSANAPRAYYIAGVTKDASGNPLGGCDVNLYLTLNDKLILSTVSDSAGNFSLPIYDGLGTYYLVSYLAGSPDVAGTTVNTLVGV